MFIASVISARTAADGPPLSFFSQAICSGVNQTFSFAVLPVLSVSSIVFVVATAEIV